MSIPKVIHYCWFGGNPLPELAAQCIESWKKFLPDYEIMRWDESNFDVNSIPYTAAAYNARKFAFVSDYARFRILYEHGGVYFDTDVEVIARMDDVLEKGPYMGRENGHDVASGLGMAAPAGLPFYREVLDYYEGLEFDTTTVVQHVTRLLEKHGLVESKDVETVAGINIYPESWFNPISTFDGILRLTPDTRTIHHFAQSWVSPSHRFFRKIALKILGPANKRKLSDFLLNLRRKK